MMQLISFQSKPVAPHKGDLPDRSPPPSCSLSLSLSLLDKRKDCSWVKMDMLTNLPQEIKEKLLTYLPIKEAGRTSILSRKWRYTWTTIPELKFDDNEINPNLLEHGLVKFIDTIFLLHSGPIRKFSLLTEEDCFDDLDKCIIYLSRNGIREIKLDLSNYDLGLYHTHSSLFSCDELNFIHLNNCDLKLPLWFQGFKLLHTLVVEGISISCKDLEKLVSCSSLLKKLVLIDTSDLVEYVNLRVCAAKLETAILEGDFINLHVLAPNLRSLEMKGRYSGFQLCAPKLSYLYIQLARPWDGQKNFARFIGDVPDLKKVQIKGLEHLPIEPWMEEFLLLNRLKYLSLDLHFMDEEHPIVLALFERLIHLQTLDIYVCYYPFERSTIWEKLDVKEDLFKQLQTVRIINFCARNSILPFVKFILGSAPHLLTLTIREDHISRKVLAREDLFKLLQFQRLSP